MIKSVQRDSHYLTEQACVALFSMWLEGKEGLRQPRTWGTIIKVLKESDLGELSEELDSVLSE